MCVYECGVICADGQPPKGSVRENNTDEGKEKEKGTKKRKNQQAQTEDQGAMTGKFDYLSLTRV